MALGEGGILSRLGRGGVHLSLNTVSPEVSAQLAKVYRQQGSHYLAATVLGRPDLAEEARLSIFFSGDPDAKARVLSLLDVLGLHLCDLGERVEVANAVKLGYNFLIAAAIEAMGEAAALVEHYGAERAQFLRMLVESPLFTGTVYEGYGRMIGERDYSDARFPVAMGLEDVELTINAQNGEVYWLYQSDAHTIMSGPLIVADHLLYVGTSGSVDHPEKSYFCALDAEKGIVRWRYTIGSYIGAVIHNESIYASSGDRYLYALERGNGSLRWTYHFVSPGQYPATIAENVL